MTDPKLSEEKVEEPKRLEVHEVNAFVVATAEKVQDFIASEVESVHPKQRFLIMCRVVTFVFDRHFKLVVNTAQDLIRKREASHDS